MKRPLPPGTIILSSGEQPRYVAFYASLMALWAALPEGCPLPRWHVGVDLCFNLNAAIRRMVGDWIWIIGDDHTFEPDVIHKLWEHDVPVVVPHCLKRNAPHEPVIWDRAFRNVGKERPEKGLMRVHLVGSAGMLIRKDVLDQIGDPWFELGNSPQRQAEDLALCRKIDALGIPIYCDVDTKIGHIANVEVWPILTQTEGWAVQYKIKIKSDIL